MSISWWTSCEQSKHIQDPLSSGVNTHTSGPDMERCEADGPDRAACTWHLAASRRPCPWACPGAESQHGSSGMGRPPVTRKAAGGHKSRTQTGQHTVADSSCSVVHEEEILETCLRTLPRPVASELCMSCRAGLGVISAPWEGQIKEASGQGEFANRISEHSSKTTSVKGRQPTPQTRESRPTGRSKGTFWKDP